MKFQPNRFLNVRFLYVFFYCIASKHSVFPPTEVSASELPAILKKLVSKEATLEAPILKLSWQPGHVNVTSFCPTQNWWKEKTGN